MSDRAKRVWLRLSDEMSRIGLLTSVDVDEFERYCEIRAAWEIARDDIAERGAVILKTNKDGKVTSSTLNPSTRVMRDLSSEIGKLADRFGLNPSSRTRIQVNPPEGDGDGDDPFAV